MPFVSEVKAREVLDSRGNPTVEVEIAVSDGAVGRALVPSGASSGAAEALELRDGDGSRFGGLGVRRAVDNVRGEIADALMGREAGDQAAADGVLIALDGTPDKSRLGANAIVGASMAFAHASAASAGQPLYRYFAGDAPVSLPAPMLNIVNGGMHAEGSTDIQEFMVVPAGFDSFREALRAGVEVFHTLKRRLSERGMATAVGDEGGFAPSLDSDREAVDLIVESIEAAGYEPGAQCFIAVDVAASELVAPDGRYSFARQGWSASAAELVSIYDEWRLAYPIVSIEDGMGEDDWDGWVELTSRLGDTVQLVGDDIFTTKPNMVARGVAENAANAALLKLNQVGTVTETVAALETARSAGWGTVVSHRSGETEDTTIADLAVGTAAGQIKAGAPSRGERTAKYNRLLRIEEELGDDAVFAGIDVYRRYL